MGVGGNPNRGQYKGSAKAIMPQALESRVQSLSPASTRDKQQLVSIYLYLPTYIKIKKAERVN